MSGSSSRHPAGADALGFGASGAELYWLSLRVERSLAIAVKAASSWSPEGDLK